MRIGLHYGRHCKVKGIAHLTTFELIIFLSLLLINAGDIELNPGPDTSQNDTGWVDDSLISSYFSVVHNNTQSILHKVLCASVYMCFVVTCWERADLLALVCGVFCEFVTFPLVSWVRCGT